MHDISGLSREEAIGPSSPLTDADFFCLNLITLKFENFGTNSFTSKVAYVAPDCT